MSADKDIKYITPEQLLQNFAQYNRKILLDIRQPDEFRHSHIPGSINIPFEKLKGSIAKLDRNMEYIVICSHGSKSPAATLLLIENGFYAKNLVGGLRDWKGSVEIGY